MRNEIRWNVLLSAGAALALPLFAGAFASDAESGAALCSPALPGNHESYRLSHPAQLAPGLSFSTDWEHIATGGWFGIQAVDGCRISVDGTKTWHGKAAARVVVQPHDDPLVLHANSERSELLVMQDTSGQRILEGPKSGLQYYATSYLFPNSWAGQQMPWSAFSRDCSEGDQNQCNSWSFVWQFYGWGGLTAAATEPDGAQRYTFNNMAFARDAQIALGRWTDFVFMVDWSSGLYKVWRRDQGTTSFHPVLMGYTAVAQGREIYVKQGLYRGGNVEGRTDVLWIGPTARGSSFAAVEQAAFGTHDGFTEN